MPEVSRLRAVLVAMIAALAAACEAPPRADADPDCHAYRSWYPQRAAAGVWDDCVHMLGEAYCRKCLVQ